MIIHMWRRWKYSTFPVDESKRAGSVLVLFFFGCRRDATDKDEARRVAAINVIAPPLRPVHVTVPCISSAKLSSN